MVLIKFPIQAPQARKMLLYVMNPEKIRRCEYLIRYHEKRGDKIIVFSDNLFALSTYARLMNRFYLEGDTSHEERVKVMDNFRQNPKVSNTCIRSMFYSIFQTVITSLVGIIIRVSSGGDHWLLYSLSF